MPAKPSGCAVAFELATASPSACCRGVPCARLQSGCARSAQRAQSALLEFARVWSARLLLYGLLLRSALRTDWYRAPGSPSIMMRGSVELPNLNDGDLTCTGRHLESYLNSRHLRELRANDAQENNYLNDSTHTQPATNYVHVDGVDV